MGMVNISLLQPERVAEAKWLITAVAQRIFEPTQTVQEFALALEKTGEFEDMDHYQDVYDGRHGVFYVLLNDGRMIGTGAVKPFAGETAEIKRIWLLEEYHGQGLGLRLMYALMDFARIAGYRRLVLQTSMQSSRALALYYKLGFKQISAYTPHVYADDLSLELEI